MGHRNLLVIALVLLFVGMTGLTGALMTAVPFSDRSAAPFSSNGQRVYYTGADANGPIPRTVPAGGFMAFGMVNAAACVDCHGEDGRGASVGMMSGSLTIPDIRYSVLARSRIESGGVEPGWTDSDIARAIREGVEPNGQQLETPMPRWDMSDADMTDLIAYLKELGQR